MTDWPFEKNNAALVSNEDLKCCENILLDIIKGSGAVALKYFRQPLSVDNKADTGFDPVTVADRECEAYISEQLQQWLPSHNMLGEETGFHDNGGELSWVVDPIDGTRSFICGVPLWGVLMALHDGKQPILGAMYQPWSDELYIGSRLGAYFHRAGQIFPLKTSTTQTVAEAKLACTTLDIFEEPSALERFESLSADARLVRFGTDCYGYALLAQGGVDLVVEDSLQPYDIQAMIPIIEAAGGVISDWQGGSAASGGQVLAAANATLHADALRYLKST